MSTPTIPAQRRKQDTCSCGAPLGLLETCTAPFCLARDLDFEVAMDLNEEACDE